VSPERGIKFRVARHHKYFGNISTAPHTRKNARDVEKCYYLAKWTNTWQLIQSRENSFVTCTSESDDVHSILNVSHALRFFDSMQNFELVVQKRCYTRKTLLECHVCDKSYSFNAILSRAHLLKYMKKPDLKYNLTGRNFGINLAWIQSWMAVAWKPLLRINLDFMCVLTFLWIFAVNFSFYLNLNKWIMTRDKLYNYILYKAPSQSIEIVEIREGCPTGLFRFPRQGRWQLLHVPSHAR